MKTIDIEITMMKMLDIRKNLVVPNVSWGAGFNHECDLLMLTPAGYATEVEIKVSRSDLIKDKNKSHDHEATTITNLYFAVPEKLEDIALEVIPVRAGLYVIITGEDNGGTWYQAKLVKNCVRKTNPVKWTNQERYTLARLGTMRILALKVKLQDASKNTI